MPKLQYLWAFDINGLFGGGLLQDKHTFDGAIKRSVSFDLFSRQYPMLFEVDVDERFDKKLLEAREDVKAMVALFLVCRPTVVVGSTASPYEVKSNI